MEVDMTGTRIAAILLLMGMLFSACSSQPPAETAAPAATDTPAAPVAVDTATETPAAADATVSPTTAAEVSATPPPTRPPNAADCTNNASFVADLTIPDNTEI